MAGQPLNDAVQGFMQGYDWMSRVRKDRRAQEEADTRKKNQRTLADTLAAGPGGLAAPEPAVAAAPATAPTQAIPAAPASTRTPAEFATAGRLGIKLGGVDGPMGTGATEALPITPSGVPGSTPSSAPDAPPGDPQVDEFESRLEQATGRSTAVGKDWNAFRQLVRKQAAADGDPNAIAAGDKMVDEIQAKGFRQNAINAARSAAIGDDQGVVRYLKKAWGYMEDGSMPSIQPVGGGKFVIMPMSEETGPDGQNKPSGQPVVLDAAAIGDMVAMTEDPAEFGRWKRKYEDDAKNREIKQQEADAKTTTAEAASTRAANEGGPGSKTAVSKEKARLAAIKDDRSRKKGLNEFITNTFMNSDEFKDMPEEDRLTFRTDVENIMNRSPTITPQKAAKAELELRDAEKIMGSRPAYKLSNGDAYIAAEDGSAVKLVDWLAGFGPTGGKK